MSETIRPEEITKTSSYASLISSLQGRIDAGWDPQMLTGEVKRRVRTSEILGYLDSDVTLYPEDYYCLTNTGHPFLSNEQTAERLSKILSDIQNSPPDGPKCEINVVTQWNSLQDFFATRSIPQNAYFFEIKSRARKVDDTVPFHNHFVHLPEPILPRRNPNHTIRLVFINGNLEVETSGEYKQYHDELNKHFKRKWYTRFFRDGNFLLQDIKEAAWEIERKDLRLVTDTPFVNQKQAAILGNKALQELEVSYSREHEHTRFERSSRRKVLLHFAQSIGLSNMIPTLSEAELLRMCKEIFNSSADAVTAYQNLYVDSRQLNVSSQFWLPLDKAGEIQIPNNTHITALYCRTPYRSNSASISSSRLDYIVPDVQLITDIKSPALLSIKDKMCDAARIIITG